MNNVLEIPKLHKVAAWNQTLLKQLIASEYFAVRYVRFPQVKIGPRWRSLNLMRVNNHLVLLDTWDRTATLQQFVAADVFGEILPDVELVIRISMRTDDPFASYFTRETGIRMTAWTMFPDGLFPLSRFEWKPCKHAYLANLTGCTQRRARWKWVKAAQQMGNFYVAPSRVSHEEYARSLQDCKWGVCLAGIGDKTRREPEFASCGMPLALNYQPHYPFPFEAGKHYLYLPSTAELELLRETDPTPFAIESRNVWEKYFSAKGAASTLLELVSRHCGESPRSSVLGGGV